MLRGPDNIRNAVCSGSNISEAGHHVAMESGHSFDFLRAVSSSVKQASDHRISTSGMLMYTSVPGG